MLAPIVIDFSPVGTNDSDRTHFTHQGIQISESIAVPHARMTFITFFPMEIALWDRILWFVTACESNYNGRFGSKVPRQYFL